MTLRQLRRRSAWLLAIPFLWLAEPSSAGILWGLAIAGPGLALRGWSAGTISKDHRLAVRGPYAHTRNPLYLGSLLVGFGVALTAGEWVWPTLFVGWFAAIYAPTILEEGRALRESFPDEYGEYAATVPAFFPRLTPYRVRPSEETVDPGTEFTWARYRKNREWEAALGAIAAFTILAGKTLF